jgi:2-iminoacetate synthase ThiH
MTTLPAGYGPLVRELPRRAAAIRQPVNGAFELTERCNLSCRMCYVRHSARDVARRQKELSASEWLRPTQDAVDNGMVFLLLTGGEVFLRPDFFDIYTPLTRLGIILTLFANGTLVTDKIAQRLAETPPSLTFAATVSSAASGTPTGSVTFYDRTTSLGNETLTGATATYTTTTLSAGTHSITATYSGDTNFMASTSAVLTQLVAAAGYTLSASPSSFTIKSGSTC